MKTINIIKILGIIGLLFLLPSISNAQIQRVWSIAEYTSTMLPPPPTGTKVAYRTLNNSLYYWDGTQWKRIAGPGIVDTSYSLSFSTPTLSLLGSGSSVSLTNLYTAGYGLIKTAETWRADTTSPNGLATRLFAKTLPTSIVAGRIAVSDGSNLVGYSGLTWNNATTTATITGRLFGNDSGEYSDSPTLPSSGSSHSTGPTSFIWNKTGGSAFQYAAAIIGSTSTTQDGLYIRTGGDKSQDRRMIHVENTDGTNVLTVRGDGSLTAATLLKVGPNTFTSSYLNPTTLTLAGASTVSHTSGIGLVFTPYLATNAFTLRQSTGYIGIFNTNPSYIIDINSTDAVRLPRGTDAQRPTNTFGLLRGNTTGNGLEFGNGTTWDYLLRTSLAGGLGTANQVGIFDINGKLTGYSALTYNGSTTLSFAERTFNLDYANATSLGVTGYSAYLSLRLSRNAYIYGESGATSLFYSAPGLHSFSTSAGVSMTLNAGGGGNYLWVRNGVSTSYTANQGIGAVGSIIAGSPTLWGNNPNVLPSYIMMSENGMYTGMGFGAVNSNLILQVASTSKAALPWPLQTTAQANAITGIRGAAQYETDIDAIRWYNGTRKAYALESTFARGTATRIPFFDINGQVTDNQYLTYNSSTNVFNTGNSDVKIASTNYGATSSVLIGSGTVGTQSVNIRGISAGNNGTTVGIGSVAGQSATALGSSVTAGNFSFGMGFDVSVSGSAAVGIGNAIRSLYTGSIAIGRASTTTATGQLVIGSGGSNSSTITDVYFGSGVQRGNPYDATSADGSSYTIHGSGALGSNFAGGNITIAGGKGTGTGTAGDVIFSTSNTGSSGSTLQTLAQRWWIKGANGRLGNVSSPQRDFHVNGEVRITDLTTDTPTRIVGADGDGDLGEIKLGSGLAFSNDTLRATGGTGTARTIPYHNNSGAYTSNINFKLDTTTTAGTLGKYYMKINAGSNTLSSADAYNVFETWSGDATSTGAIFSIADQAVYNTTAGYAGRFMLHRYGTSLTSASNLTTGNEIGLYGFGGWVNGSKTNFLGGISGFYTGTGFTLRSDLVGRTATTSGLTNGWKLDSLSRFWLGDGADDYYFPTSRPSPTTGVKSRQVWTAGIPSWELDRKSLIDSLPLGSIVIDANTNDLTIDNLTNLDFTTEGGNGSMQLNDESFQVEADEFINLSTGTDAQLRLDNEVELHAPNLEGVNRMRVDSIGFHYSFTNTEASPDSAMSLLTDYDRGLLKLHKYGKDNHTSTTIGEYTVRVAGISSSGYVQDFRLARDTFIEDVTLFSVGTMLYDCQELTIVSSMTVLAESDQEIRFPDAAEELRGKKIIVYIKKKEGGLYLPKIKVVGGVSRLYFTTDPGTGGTDPDDESELLVDDSTWSYHGATYEFTCLKINSTDYRWVLKQR